MMKIEAIVQISKFESVKDALIAIGIEGMTASEVPRGHGRQKGHTETFAATSTTSTSFPRSSWRSS